MIKDYKNIIKQLAYIMTDKQKIASVGVIVLIIVSACLEMLGISVVVPFIEALVSPEILRNEIYIKVFEKYITINSDLELIYITIIAIILVYVVKNAFLMLSSFIQIRFRFRFQKDLSVKILSAYMKRPYTFFLDVNSSEVLRGITSDVAGVNTIINNLFQGVMHILTIILIAVYLISLDWILAIGMLFIALMCFLLIALSTRKKIQKMGKVLREVNAEQMKYVTQAVNGIKEFSVMQKRSFFVDKYEEAYDKKIKADIKYNFTLEYPARIIETTCIVGLFAVICFRLIVGIDIVDFIAKLGAFAVAAFKILPSISAISQYMTGIIYFKPSLVGIYDNIFSAEEYNDMLEKYYSNNKILDEEVQGKKNFKQILEVDNVSWKYKSSKEYIFQKLNLSIIKGESVAFIGTSGAGKTTLADMILGLLPPQEGKIMMDGTNIYAIPQRWSEIISYVPQNVYMIDDTIKSNIALGSEERDIDDELIWEVLEKAQLKEYIQGLPEGINTIVGERGMKLSGGQKQRIAIARALYTRPQILVLDEATSALDSETEEAVMQAIETLHGSITMIIVAHRLTTIQKCDKVYKITNGQAILQDKEKIFK